MSSVAFIDSLERRNTFLAEVADDIVRNEYLQKWIDEMTPVVTRDAAKEGLPHFISASTVVPEDAAVEVAEEPAADVPAFPFPSNPHSSVAGDEEAKSRFIKIEHEIPQGHTVASLRALAEVDRDELIHECLRLANETEGWVSNGTSKGVKLEKKDTGAIPMMRGTINFGSRWNAFDVMDFFRNWDNMKMMDPMVLEGKMLGEFDYWTAALWVASRGMLLFDGREVVQRSNTRVVDERTVVSAVRSVEWPTVPKAPKRLVRADVLIGGHVLRHMEDGTLQVTYVMQMDMKVNVHRSALMRAPFMTEMPATLGTMKTLMEKHGVKPVAWRPWDVLEKMAPIANDCRDRTVTHIAFKA